MHNGRFDRREFIHKVAKTGAAAALAGASGAHALGQDAQPAAAEADPATEPTTPPAPSAARYFGPKAETGELPCLLCPRGCKIKPKARGHCQAYEHTAEGHLESLGYGKIAKLGIEPIEIDHFYHVLPGSQAVFVGAPSCNLHCSYCAEWKISQFPREKVPTEDIEPQALVDQVAEEGGKLLGFTYSDPAVALEYATDVAIAAREAGIHPIAHTAGYIMPEPMKDYASVLSAINVDIKAYTDATYKRVCQGSLQPVLDAIKAVRETNAWLELTYTVVPGSYGNSTAGPIKDMCKWIVDNCGPLTPLHFSRFVPRYKHRTYQTPITAQSTLKRFRETAYEEGLLFVYIDGVPGDIGESTICPKCKEVIIRRVGTNISGPNFDATRGLCTGCGTGIPGIWK